jgi:hypothetical protein
MPQLTLYSYKKSEKREAPAQASLFDEKEKKKYVWDRAILDYFALDTSTPELFQKWIETNPPYCSIL